METAALFPEMSTAPAKPDYRKLNVVRIALVKEKPILYNAERITSPEQSAAAFRALVGDVDREYFAVLMIDVKNRIVSASIVAIGTLNQALIHPREVFKAAILANAAAVVLCHNHPSGDPSPSQEDIKITRLLKESGDILCIKVLDHVIVGGEDNYSFAKVGLL